MLAVLTLVAAVFELGVVVVLVRDEDGDLADPDERLVGLICGRHRQSELPLTLPVETRRRGDHTCGGRVTTATVINRQLWYS